MKKLVILLICSIVFCFSSCKFSITTNTENKNIIETTEELRTFYISINSDQARTALPEFEWSDFTFDLTAIQTPDDGPQKPAVKLFEGREYYQFNSGIQLVAAKYKFILDAYKNGQKAFSGELIFDLSMGDSTLVFDMLPVSNSIGSVNIKISYPNDGTVSKIKAMLSSEFFIEEDEENSVELTSRIISGVKVANFTQSNLPSNTEQYVNFWFYDSNNTIVYSGCESVIVVGGCVSTSEIILTKEDWHTYINTISLLKDNENWINSGKTVSLVNKSDSSKVYNLKPITEGKYTGSVAEGMYYIYVNNENTDIEFNSVDKSAAINYYTVELDPAMMEDKTITVELSSNYKIKVFKKVRMEVVSGAIEVNENKAVVQEGKSFIYQILLNKGYKVTDKKVLIISQNNVQIENPAFSTDIVISTVTEPILINVENVTHITYNIKYLDSDGTEIVTYANRTETSAYFYSYDVSKQILNETWVPAKSYNASTVTNFINMKNIRKPGYYFDVWKDQYGNVIKDTTDRFEDLTLTATWKSAPTIRPEIKTIYANGFSLIITGDTNKTNNATYIYVDLDSNGSIKLTENGGEDWQITCDNISLETITDFSGYTIRAGTENGDEIYSDYTITMTGGIISSIYGLGKRTNQHPYISRLNISGTAVIGSFTGENTVVNLDSTKRTTATSVEGIFLETFSDERVNISGQMTNYTDSLGQKQNYRITCITPYKYDLELDHTIALIKNSSYATFNNLTCWTDLKLDPSDENPNFEKCILAQKNVIENSVTRTLINLSEDVGVVLPKADEVKINEFGEVSLGNEVVTSKCSVFSIAVENGYFRCNERLTITANETDEDLAVENTLTYMAQPTPTTYVEEFEFDKQYVYMQVISAGNQLTPEIASEFLGQLCFKRADPLVPLTVSINLEKVPSDQIQGKGDGKGGPEFKYFNGSFYKRVAAENSWTAAYNASKTNYFNGLQGYLMNITSLVENNYIYDTFYKIAPDKLSWAGGSTYVPDDKINDGKGNQIPRFDQEVYSSKTSKDKWIWQAGPEAGMVFYNTPTYKAGSEIPGVFQHWNNKILFEDQYTSNINDTSYPLRGVAGEEPNTVSGGTTGEPCMQFLAGLQKPSKGDYYANGFWNNLKDGVQNDTYKTTGYIIEFTPYQTIYGTQTASYTPIKRTATY